MDPKDIKQDSLLEDLARKKGIDYGETFSPAANITSIRILMQMVV